MSEDVADSRGPGSAAGDPPPGAGSIAGLLEGVLAGDRVRTELVTFVRRLRDRGVAVPGDGSLVAAETLAALDDRDRDRVRTALRAALCSRPGDLAVFDDLFPVFWSRVHGGDDDYPEPDGDPPVLGAGTGSVADTPGEADPDAGSVDDGVSGGSLPDGSAETGVDAGGTEYSPEGRGRRVSLDDVADVDVTGAVASLTRAVATLQGRRTEPGGREPDPRRALRRSATRGGVALPLPGQSRERSGARGVVLVDVSGSVLDAVDRAHLVAVLHEIREQWRRTSILFFDTRLRDVSEAFDAPSTGAAVGALAEARVEWGGGTRMADALGTLRAEHPDAVDRRGTAVVVSDGLERGDLDDLRAELAWLSGRANHLLWLNPLASDPRWSPSAPGMRAALPYLDGLYAFADVEDLRDVADSIARHGPDLVRPSPDRRR